MELLYSRPTQDGIPLIADVLYHKKRARTHGKSAALRTAPFVLN